MLYATIALHIARMLFNALSEQKQQYPIEIDISYAFDPNTTSMLELAEKHTIVDSSIARADGDKQYSQDKYYKGKYKFITTEETCCTWRLISKKIRSKTHVLYSYLIYLYKVKNSTCSEYHR